MKRRRLICVLSAPSRNTRLHEIDNTIGGFIDECERQGKQLGGTQISSLVGIAVEALSAPDCSKAFRRLCDLCERVGQIAVRNGCADAACEAALETLNKADSKSEYHLQALQALLRGMCKGGLKPIVHRAKRAAVHTCHDGKHRRTTAQETAEVKPSRAVEASVEAVMASGAGQTLLKRVMSLLCELLPAAPAKKPRAIPAVLKCTRSWLRTMPQLVEYVLKAAEQADGDECLPAAACCAELLSRGGELKDADAERLGNACARAVKNGGERCWLWTQWLVSLPNKSAEKAAAAAFGTVVSEIKRSTRSVLPAFGALVRIFRAHCGASVAVLQPLADPVAAAMKDASLRTSARNAVLAVMESADLVKLRKALLSALTTQLSPSLSLEEKNAAISALTECLETLFPAGTDSKPHPDAVAAVTDSVCSSLKPLIITGATEVRHKVLSFVGMCCGLTGKCPEYMTAVLKDAMTGSDDAMRRRALAILPDLQKAEPKKVKDLQAAVTKICKDSEKKPGARADALIACAVCDIPAGEKWFKDGCLGPAPLLFSHSTLSRFSEPWELIAAVRACHRFFKPKTDLPGFSAPRDLGPMQGLLSLAMHPRHAVRGVACATIAEVMQNEPKHVFPLWTALLATLWGPSPEVAAASAAGAAAGPAAKPAAKSGKKPAPKGGAKDKGKDAGPVTHDLVTEQKKWGLPRSGLWTLSVDCPAVVGGDSSRADPPAADVFVLVANEVLKRPELATTHTLAEVAMTSGHPNVSGPPGTFFDATSNRLKRYRVEPSVDAFARVFGHRVYDAAREAAMTKDEDSDDEEEEEGAAAKPKKEKPPPVEDQSAPARLWRGREDVFLYLVKALRDAGSERGHVRVAAARAMAFCVGITGGAGFGGALCNDGPVEAPAAEAAPPAAAAAAAADAEPAAPPPLPLSLCGLVRGLAQQIRALSDKELRVAVGDIGECVQEQLEHDGLVKKEGKPVHNVKRDKSQKGYSKEDEDWAREHAARKMAEKGIEDPKVAKAREQYGNEFSGVKKRVWKVIDTLRACLLSVAEVSRLRHNHSAVHDCAPVIVPLCVELLRDVPINAVRDLAADVLDWVYSCSPVQGLAAIHSTLSRLTVVLCEMRGTVEKSAVTPYTESVVAFSENIVRNRLRHVCSTLLPEPSYSFIFPIAEAILRHTNQTTTFSQICTQMTLHMVSTNCGLPDMPHRSETSKALLCVLERMPQQEKAITAAVSSLAEHLQPSELGPLTASLVVQSEMVREAAVTGLKAYPALATANPGTRYHLLCAVNDPNRQVAEKAAEVWQANDLSIDEDYAAHLVPVLLSAEPAARLAAAAACAQAAKQFPHTQKATLQQMFRTFDEHLRTPAMAKTPDRVGAASAISAAAANLAPDCVELVTKFVTARALLDPLEIVRAGFLAAFKKVITLHGKQSGDSIYPVLSKAFLAGTPPPLPAGMPAVSAEVRELYTSAIVVAMGELSAEMGGGDHLEKLPTKLINTCQTTSKVVAKSVGETLEVVVQIDAVVPQRAKLAQKCLERIVKGSASPAIRRGFSYGLAGIIKGSKLPALGELGVTDALQEAMGSKGAAKEGSLICQGVLCDVLKTLYEPYVIASMDNIVECFGDKDASVRNAAASCAEFMMKSLTSFGVRQILPRLLAAFTTDQWKTKVSALDLLGQMSYCDRQQLAAALPKVVPVLTETLSDTHHEVQGRAWEALRRVGGVISNPEISRHAEVLLTAIKNPDNTDDALEALMYTRFANKIDAASLAIVQPIIHRGLMHRVSQTKVKSAQILGQITRLVDPITILVPYIPMLMPSLKNVLTDEFPDCRMMSAKAIGSLLLNLGEERFPDFIDWCIHMLEEDGNSIVERSGAAQGFCEVIAALGKTRLERGEPTLLESIVQKSTVGSSHTREGYLQILVFLPHALGTAFQEFLDQFIPCIVQGISDPAEGVRSTALRGGNMVVDRFGAECLDQLLPPLKRGLLNAEWRVRLSSLQLLGNLLVKIAGQNQKGAVQVEEESDYDEEEEEEEEEDEEDEEDEEEESDDGEDLSALVSGAAKRRRRGDDKTANQIVLALRDTLGGELFGELISALYMMTLDVQAEVAREAKRIWKLLVDNTPAMLRCIMLQMTELLIGFLSSDVQSDDKDEQKAIENRRAVASACLGDLTDKLGDGFLPSILPVLQGNLDRSNKVVVRSGAVLGLIRVSDRITRVHLAAHRSVLLPCIVQAITDPDDGVRAEAGNAFDVLFKRVGGKALAPLMTQLIDDIGSGKPEQQEIAMAGTMEMVKMRPKAVLDILVPTLTCEPVLSLASATSLTRVASVAGEVLNDQGHIRKLVSTLVSSLGSPDLPYRDEVVKAAQSVISTLTDAKQLSDLMADIRLAVQSTSAVDRRGGVGLIAALVTYSEGLCLKDQWDALIQNVIRLYADPEASVQMAAVEAMGSLRDSLKAIGELGPQLTTVHGALLTAAQGTFGSEQAEKRMLPALALKNEKGANLGVMSVFPFFRESLSKADADAKQEAAKGLRDLMKMASAETMQDTGIVGAVLGALVSAVSAKLPGLTLAAVIECMADCVAGAGAAGKAWPMVITTFAKKMNNPDACVRKELLRGLYLAITHQQGMKPDQSITSLCLELKTQHHEVIETSLVRGVSLLLEKEVRDISAMAKKGCKDYLLPVLERVRTPTHAAAVGKAVGMVAPYLGPDETMMVVVAASGHLQAGGVVPTVAGLAAWQGLLKTGVGRGLQYDDLVSFCDQTAAALSTPPPPPVILAAFRAGAAFAKHGGCAEVGGDKTVKLAQALGKCAELLLAGDRTHTHIEEKGSRALAAIAAVVEIPKVQQALNKVQKQLFAGTGGREDWEMCSEYGDEVADDDEP